MCYLIKLPDKKYFVFIIVAWPPFSDQLTEPCLTRKNYQDIFYNFCNEQVGGYASLYEFKNKMIVMSAVY